MSPMPREGDISRSRIWWTGPNVKENETNVSVPLSNKEFLVKQLFLELWKGWVTFQHKGKTQMLLVWHLALICWKGLA
jgi:hypothetical protein